MDIYGLIGDVWRKSDGLSKGHSMAATQRLSIMRLQIQELDLQAHHRERKTAASEEEIGIDKNLIYVWMLM
jgi:hypothetical protein